MRKTKIICTLGPKTRDNDSIKQLLEAGADAIRINFSHDNHEIHGETAKRVIEIREEMGKPIPLILDTKGPEIRTGDMKNNIDQILSSGDIFTLTTDEVEGDNTKVSITYKKLPNDLEVGSSILIDDGLIELNVKTLTNTEIKCEVVNGGILGSRKGINIPDSSISLPALTDRDIEDIKFAAELGFDYIAASFIRCGTDIIKIREILEAQGNENIHIIAKIENREGVNNIDEIIDVADGIMIARGDLGVEIPIEEVPIIQKEIIKAANKAGKLVVTATQMLDSMIRNPRPTRAEAADVANAIFDGTSAIMLSGETANGDYPLEALNTMSKIALAAELEVAKQKRADLKSKNYGLSMTNAISNAACHTAKELEAEGIVAITKSGYTANSIAKFKPNCQIIACTSNKFVLRQLNLVWGCVPIYIETPITEMIDKQFKEALIKIQEKCILKDSDIVVLTAGVPLGAEGASNVMKVQYVGNVLGRGIGFGNKEVIGKATVVRAIDTVQDVFNEGDILVTYRTNNTYLPYMKKASAIIIEENKEDLYDHTVIMGEALNIPVIVAASGIMGGLKNGTTIKVDSSSGYVYSCGINK